MDTITRKDAKAKGLKRYFTGNPCKNGHIAERSVVTGTCSECKKKFDKQHVERNFDHISARKAEWHAATYDPEKRRAYRQSNREALLQMTRDWKKANRGAVSEHNATRRAAKLQRTPAWADLKAIKAFYEECPSGMTVDHVIPLQGDLVSGLHVHNNLQYLTGSENSSKCNSFDVEGFC